MLKIELIGSPHFIDPKDISELTLHYSRIFQLKESQLLEIKFVSPGEIKSLNKLFRNIDQITDVLSFPQTLPALPNKIFGTIVICEQEGRLREESTEELIKHGLLHLSGFDHDSDSEGWKKAAIKIDHNMGI